MTAIIVLCSAPDHVHKIHMFCIQGGETARNKGCGSQWVGFPQVLCHVWKPTGSQLLPTPPVGVGVRHPLSSPLHVRSFQLWSSAAGPFDTDT